MWYQALVNILGIATWYLLGTAYISTASRLWPVKESYRSKWLPWDILDAMQGDPDVTQLKGHSHAVLAIVITVAFMATLTIWPVMVYVHAKRGFRTGSGKHTK